MAFDLETTGLSAAMDRIVEIAAVRSSKPARKSPDTRRSSTPTPVPSGAYAVHGLADELLSHAPTAREVLPAFLAFIGDAGSTSLLAHNAAFDAGFLGTEWLERAWRFPIAKSLTRCRCRGCGYPRFRAIGSRRSPSILVSIRRGHRAMADSLLVKQIWLRLGGPQPGRRADRIQAFRRPRKNRAPRRLGGARAGRRAGQYFRSNTKAAHAGRPCAVTPRRLESRGGCIFLVALCHIDFMEKSFRVDRIRTLEFTPEAGAGVVRVDRQAAES